MNASRQRHRPRLGKQLRVLQVCNVAEILGGTLQCAHSVTKALTKARHSVFCLSGQPSTECKREFKDHRFLWGSDLQGEVDRFRPDIIILHNTAQERLPRIDEALCLPIYYLHSAYPAKAGSQFRLKFSVSKFLANKVGWQEDTVLYQPIHVPSDPDPVGARRKGTVGRIATQKREWWDVEQTKKFVDALPDGKKRFEPVTVFDDIHALTDTENRRPSVAAKRLLWEWEYVSCLGKSETFGRVVREAQMCGCVPIVSKGSGGPEEVVKNWGGIIADSPEDAAARIAVRAKDWEYPIHGNDCRLSWWRTEFIKRVATAQLTKGAVLT